MKNIKKKKTDARTLTISLGAALACLGATLPAAASGLLTYLKKYQMSFTSHGDVFAKAHWNHLIDEDSEPSDHHELIDLFDTGGTDSWSFTHNVSASIASGDVSADADAGIAAVQNATASRNSIVIINSVAGDAFGETHKSIACVPLEPKPLFPGFIAKSTAGGVVEIPFYVTDHCFATLLVVQHALNNTAESNWLTDIHQDASSDLDNNGIFYWSGCVAPGPYSIAAIFDSGLEVDGEVDCRHLDVEDGGPYSSGFALNLNFHSHCTCAADINNDGTVGTPDLLAVINNWGCIVTAANLCPGDVNHDGTVGTPDMLAVLGAWGACPCCLK